MTLQHLIITTVYYLMILILPGVLTALLLHAVLKRAFQLKPIPVEEKPKNL